MNLFKVENYRWLLVVVIALGSWLGCNAQKNDYIWLSGYESNTHADTGVGLYFGNTIMNFNNSPVGIYFDSTAMNFDKTNTSYCDSDGNLLFYTNGIYIANSLNEKIKNSDSLNAGWLQYVWAPAMQVKGYRLAQGILALPAVSQPGNYYLVHSFLDSLPGSNGTLLYGPKVFSTYIDMNANNGHGIVDYKNKTIMQDTLGWELAACKHGNGRDWWVLVPKRNSNCYYRIAINDAGLKPDTILSCSGVVTSTKDVGVACFSPDGSKYINFNFFIGIKIFDFDRCAGELFNPVFVPLTILKDSNWYGMGVAISPNNRFLYVTATNLVYQYDLMAADIEASIDTVAIYDKYWAPLPSVFNTAQLGPDGKIYISCGNSDSVYHVINNPDAKGAACQFTQHGIKLPTLSCGVPSFPNYRLGALMGSSCDTLTGLSEPRRAAKEQIIKVYPNPATDYAFVDYGFTDWSKGPVNLEICNAVGQTVYARALPVYSGLQKIDVSAFANGMYTVYVKRQGAVVATNKLVKQ